MTASELIEVLTRLRQEVGGDPEVLAQSHGCCSHGHPIEAVEAGSENRGGINTMDEYGCIVIRV